MTLFDPIQNKPTEKGKKKNTSVTHIFHDIIARPDVSFSLFLSPKWRIGKIKYSD
jgi:hypothetical protein